MAKRNLPEETVILDSDTFKSNSNSTKEKNIQSVVKSTNITKRKKSLSERFTSMFVSEDAGDVKSYLILDILIPAFKDTIVDMVQGGIEAIFYGNDRPRGSKRSAGSVGPKVSYQKYYDQPSGSNRRGSYSGNNSRVGRYDHKVNHDFRDVVFSDKRDAIAVLDGLVGLTIKYEFATIMDMNQLAGQESNFTDNDFGWDDLQGARVKQVRNGYVLDLPTPGPID